MKDGVWGIPLKVPLDDYIKQTNSKRFEPIFEGQTTDGQLYVMDMQRKEQGSSPSKAADSKVRYIVKAIDETEFAKEGDCYLRFFHCKHIVKNYDQVVSPMIKKRYLILEFIDGGSLINKLNQEKRGTFSQDEVMQIGLETLQGLNCLHSQSIYHMDIKPDNICWDQINNQYKLIDFGRSKVDSEATYALGTHIYDCPERRARISIKDYAASDLFCLGLSLFRLWLGSEQLATLSGHIDQIIKENRWQEKGRLDLKLMFCTKTRTGTDNDLLINLIKDLLVLNPDERASADTLLSKYGGQKCQQLHLVPMIRPRPPHLLPKGTKEHNERFDQLLRKYSAILSFSRPSLLSGRNSSLKTTDTEVSEEPNGRSAQILEDRMFTGVSVIPDERKLSGLTAKKTASSEMSAAKKTQLQSVLENEPQLLARFLDNQLGMPKQKESGPFAISAEDAPIESVDLQHFRLPKVCRFSEDFSVPPVQMNREGFMFGDQHLTGLGIVCLNTLGAFYVGQFERGEPNGFGILAHQDTMQDHEAKADGNLKNRIEMYLQNLFRTDGQKSPDKTKRLRWQNLFKFEDVHLTLFAGQFKNGQPETSSKCWLQYSDGMTASARVSDWTLSGACSLFFGDRSSVDGIFSNGVLDRHHEFKICSMQPAVLRSRIEKETIFHRESPGKIVLLTEDGWRYESEKWQNYKDSSGTISMSRKYQGLEFKYKGAWRDFQLCAEWANLELQIHYKQTGNDRLSTFSLEPWTSFKALWVSKDSDQEHKKSKLKSSEKDLAAKEVSSKKLEVKYTGGFKENNFDNQSEKTPRIAELDIKAKWLDIEVQYTGYFKEGRFHGPNGKLKLVQKGRPTIKIESEFQDGGLHGAANIQLCDPSSEKEVLMVVSINFKAGKPCGLLRIEWPQSDDLYCSFETYFSEEGDRFGTTGLFLGLKKGKIEYRHGSVYTGQVLIRRGSPNEKRRKFESPQKSQNLSLYPNDSVLRNPLFCTLDGIGWDTLSGYFQNFCEVTLERSGQGTCNLAKEDARLMLMDMRQRYTRYEGDWLNDCILGKGKMEKESPSWHYEGYFNKMGLYHGPGILEQVYANRRYTGSFSDGRLPEGLLKYEQNGCKYEYQGEFDSDFLEHGTGKLKTPDFTADVRCDRGTVYWARIVYLFENGCNVYQGKVKNFNFDDDTGGARLVTNRFQYQGSFKDNLIVGRGLLTVHCTNPELTVSDEIQFYDGPVTDNMTFGQGAKIMFFNGDEFSGIVEKFKDNRIYRESNIPMDGFEQSNHTSNPKDSSREEFQVDYPTRLQLYGKGTFKSRRNSRVYNGYLVQGYPQGKGVCTGLLGGQEFTYEGDFVRGLFHGPGNLTFKNKDYLQSTMWDQDVLKHGVIYHAATGQKYEGEILNYTRHGTGVVTYPDNDKSGFRLFRGTFKHGRMEGEGVMEFQNGAVFEGRFLNGSQNGPGIKTTANYILKGEGFRSFRLVGPALYYKFTKHPCGDLFEGIFEEGALESGTVYKDCKGFPTGPTISPESLGCFAVYKGKINSSDLQLTDPKATVDYVRDKMRYEGGLVKYLRDGPGELQFKSDHNSMKGIAIRGTFKKDKTKGSCSVHYSDHGKLRLYLGELDDKFLPKGKGIIYFQDQKKWHGNFENGKPKGKGELFQNLTKLGDIEGQQVIKDYFTTGN